MPAKEECGNMFNNNFKLLTFYFSFISSEFNRDKFIFHFVFLRKHYITIPFSLREESPNSIGFVIKFYCFINLGSIVKIELLMAALNAAKDSGEVSILKSVSPKFSCQ